MRVLVCGGRDWRDGGFVSRVLTQFHANTPITRLITGGATGVDSYAGGWAAVQAITIETYFAKWGEHGRAAGPIRNKQMLDEGKPDVVIAFPGGRGTANMVKQAREAGVRVIEAMP